MRVEKGDRVKAVIQGETENGGIFFSNTNTHPVEFRVNSRFFLKGIEHVVVGMRKGEKKEAVLNPENSYGYRNNALIKTLPKSFYYQKKKEGDTLTYFDFRKKKPVEGVVVKAQPKTIIVDFNHSLCGQTIKYKVEILDIMKD